ncbi:MAG: glycosyltransferase [Phycisphaerales bacterium]|nr:glycosyltransferase [Phycisphaerales bacterium]
MPAPHLVLVWIGWVLVALCAAVAAYWTIALVRIASTVWRMPRVRDGLDAPEPADGWPLVSVIVPAHNEERVIDACARALRAQDHPRLEIVFVLDRCTDRTAALLAPHAREDRRIVVIENTSCPDDWAGKCNAARVGAAAAKGDWLLFTDADTQFGSSLVRAAIGSAVRRRLGLLSLLGRLTTHRWFERIVQPVASMNLIRMYPIARANRPPGHHRPSRPFANGQFMLFDRNVYAAVGGHEAVKDDLLEDIAFARLVHEAGYATGVEHAGDLLAVAMYDTFAGFRKGWRRIFIEACKRKPARLRRNGWRCLGAGLAAPVVQIAALVGAGVLAEAAPVEAALLGGSVATGLLLQGVALAWIYQQQGAPIWGVVLFPFGAVVVARTMFAGAADLVRREPIEWGGRSYVLRPR